MLRIAGREIALDSLVAYPVRKRGLETRAVQLHQPFEVDAWDGVLVGKPGDWVVYNAAGYWEVFSPEIFTRLYEVIP